jgi:hypothetical protein
MSILDVCYRVAHDYAGGGVKALAVRMGMSYQVLQNKLNPNCDTHHLTVEQAAQIADMTGTDDIAKAFAERRNMVCIPVAQHPGASDMELLDLIISMESEKAEMLDAIKKSLQDGKVDQIEAGKIRKEYMDLVAAIAELLGRIEGMVQEVKS